MTTLKSDLYDVPVLTVREQLMMAVRFAVFAGTVSIGLFFDTNKYVQTIASVIFGFNSGCDLASILVSRRNLRLMREGLGL